MGSDDLTYCLHSFMFTIYGVWLWYKNRNFHRKLKIWFTNLQTSFDLNTHFYMLCGWHCEMLLLFLPFSTYFAPTDTLCLEPNYEISNQILLHSFLIDTKISILLLWKLISMSNVDKFHGTQLFCMRDCIDMVQQICLWSSFYDGDFITCALWCAYIHSIEQSKIKRKPHLLGDSSSVVSAAGGVVTVDDDWWCEWWFLWCDNIRCDWWWCEWECALFELAELVEGCGGGGNPCDFVIVNSPFDVVNLRGESILCKWNFGNFQKTRRRKQ